MLTWLRRNRVTTWPRQLDNRDCSHNIILFARTDALYVTMGLHSEKPMVSGKHCTSEKVFNTPNLPNITASPGLPQMRSEYLHQPAVGQNRLTPRLCYNTVLSISCNLLKTVSKQCWQHSTVQSIICPPSWQVADWGLWSLPLPCSTRGHYYVTSAGKDRKSKFKAWFLLNTYI